jgi:uncharacterized membrane protein
VTWRLVAISLLTFLFCVNVYRAVTQSLTIDEAYTYNRFLSTDLRVALTEYDANNHVMYTLLAKPALRFFGGREWVIRLPSVLAGLLYFVVVYLLARFLFGEGWLFLLAVAAMSLNPYMLDFLSCARGYGMGIAFWLLGLYWMWNGRLTRAGFAFGLAVAANLTLLFPIVALMALQLRKPFEFIDRLALPCVATAFVVLVIPISHLQPGSFYVGAESAWTGILTVTMMSVGQDWMRQVAGVVIGLVIVIAVLALRGRDEQLRMLIASFGIMWIVLVAARYLANLKYPELRTGLYLIPFFTLLCLLALRGRHWLFAAPLFVLIAVYFGQWRTSYYGEWTFDSATKQVAELLRQEKCTTVGASWELVQTLRYYRVPQVNREPDGDFTCFVLLPSSRDLVEKRRLRVIWQDSLSEVVVAEK